MDRDRIDKVRRLLLDAFMSEDMPTYSQCVVELEKLIGVPAGDRNPHDTSRFKTPAQNKKHAAKARQYRWGDRTLDAEIHEDGTMVYSINYGKPGDD